MKKTRADELKMGRREEMEHTDDPQEAEDIARTHLRKSRDYYEKLKIAESHSLPQLKRLIKKEGKQCH